MTKPDTSRYYLTTPIYYVNARPHLGTAYTTIVCDAVARRKRALGIDTWFLTGTDEHGQKIERSATLAGRTPQEFVGEMSQKFRTLWDRMGLSYDDFIRTTEARHIRGVQHLFASLRDRGFIYKGSYTGQYCVSDEAWVDVPPGAPCPDCGRITETVSEENYFFKLSAFERKLLEFYEANPGFMQPESTRREIISFVRSGLKDVSVSRTSVSWGIPVPGDEKHVIYVWFDALVNYATAVGYGSDDPQEKARFEKFWPADLHVIGKDIARFHCVYWPAFLMAAGIETPRSVRTNGWLMFDQGKMSKSRGNVVSPEAVDAVLGIDALRYFLLREIPFGQDGGFSFEALIQRYNSDLANGYGNLVSRVANMMHKYFGGIVPEAGAEAPAESALRERAAITITEFGTAFDELNFSDALRSVWGLVSETDGYLTAHAPWKKPTDRPEEVHRQLQARVLATAAEAIRIITALVYPVLPDSAARVWQQLGLGKIQDAAKLAFLSQLAWGGLKAGTGFGEPAPLFPRAERDAIDRMQSVEEENNPGNDGDLNEGGAVVPAPPPASPAVAPTAGVNDRDATADDAVTPATTAPLSPEMPVATTKVRQVPAELTSSRLNSTPAAVPASAPAAPPQAASSSSSSASGAPAGNEGAQKVSAASSGVITIDDFGTVDLRVAQILVAERVPKADKLLRLEVDLGYEKRQILAGIAQHYEAEKLIGRKIVIVANLAPRKMRGLESNGMLLAASLPDGAPILAGFLEDVPLGARLK